MRYHLDTIPVWDAVRKDTECFLCALRSKTEREQIEHYLGASVMEPDTRIRVNEHGFCAKHQKMLYDAGNRLGHALMLKTHLEETEKRLERIFSAIQKAAETYSAAGLKDKMNGKAKAAAGSLQEQAEKIAAMAGDCVVCMSITEHIRRYLHTFYYLYHTDQEFRTKLAGSKGLCLPDCALLIRYAAEELPAREVADLTELLIKITKENLKRTEEDVSWLIRKFDYRFESEPWKNSRDSVERACNKLCGRCVGGEEKE